VRIVVQPYSSTTGIPTTIKDPMNNPNPLPPLSPLSQPAKGKSNVRIFVMSIVALHAVFLGGLLFQGCKKNPTENATAANTALGNTNLDIPPLTNNPYAGADSTNGGTTAAPTAAESTAATQTPTNPVSTTTTVATPPAAPITPAVTPSSAATDYTVVKGDYPAKIAKDHGVTTVALLKANPGLNPKKMKVGQKLNIPAAASTAATGASAASAVTGGSDKANGLAASDTKAVATSTGDKAGALHVVRTGDNLTKIAHEYHVSVKSLRAANSLKTDRIHVGQKLKIPAAKTAMAAAEPTQPRLALSAPPTLMASSNH